jgi:hypothetical protein
MMTGGDEESPKKEEGSFGGENSSIRVPSGQQEQPITQES